MNVRHCRKRHIRRSALRTICLTKQTNKCSVPSVLDSFAKFRKATISFVMFVCLFVCLSVGRSALNSSVPIKLIFMKFDIWVFFKNLFRKFKFDYNPTKIAGTLHEDLRIIMISSRGILLRVRNVSDKVFREIRIKILSSKNLFF